MSWEGNLKLEFACRDGSTQLVLDYSQAPLKVQRPFYPEGNEVCHSTILHTAGGVVGGDRLNLNLHLSPQSQALVSTAAANKIYGSNGQIALQNIKIQLDSEACLEWLPQETIVFDGAIYRQNLTVELAPQASWLGWEITRFGRTARGEKFVSGDWRSHTEVWQAGQPLWIDRQWLPGDVSALESPHGLAGCAIAGSMAWIGSAVTPEMVAEARKLWVSSPYGSQAGVTRLERGMLCRYLGNDIAEVRNWFISVWQLLRPFYLARNICLPRVWQL
ncbi:urease accessory protein UreD [Merismopedia glauca]|uniref:Urease accessory protein UreD n=1 Tax=Merismopedia glauca CCAP 1448/3 TaxID=1296344 RepID=A0A2T1C3A4_9CYAN|nr:urease accessory protein UreD [Merismopedia glauca]PSB02750.1 urease accessory protein [Merismopedia glauca CCAP 1448/3]